MSKKARRTPAPHKQPDTAQAEPGPVSLPPLKPRPRLFYALLTALALWVGFLLVLYFTTVYPNRDTQRPHSASGETASATS